MKSIILAGLAGVAAAVPAHAQNAETQTAQLEEIVVTAQRRAESLQRAALSVEVISAEDMQAANITNLQSILSTVPSVVVQGTTPGANVYVRGIGTNASSGDPSINLNVDGVYLQRATAGLGATYDLQRIEVLRGPQGTLYGRNANAGSVNIITAAPVLGEFGGGLSVSAGNYGSMRGEGVANLPLSDTVAARVAFASERQDGFLSNGNDDVHSDAARLKVLFAPSDTFQLTAYTDYLALGGNGGGTVRAPLSSHADDPWYSNLANNDQKIVNQVSYLRADIDLGWANLVVQPSYIHGSTDTDSAQASSPQAYGGVEDTWAGEVRLTSPTGSPISWVAGVYAYDTAIVQETYQSRLTTTPFTLQGSEAKAQSYAAFAQATFPIGERLRLTGGLRYTADEKSYYQYSRTAESSNAAKWDNLTFKAGFEFDAADASMIYGSVSSGFKAGGFAATQPPQPYDPEEITAFTLGSKNLLMDGRLRLNLEAFYYDYTGYQVTFPAIVNGIFAQFTTNASSAKPYGADLDVEYAVTDNGRLSVGLSYLRSEYGDFRYTDSGGAKDFTGQQLLQSPEWSGSAAYEHDIDLGDAGSLTGRISTRWSSSYPIALQGAETIQDSYTRTDASLTWSPPSGNWTVGAYVRNIEDEPVKTFALFTPSLTTLKLQAPRTYGMRVGVRF